MTLAPPTELCTRAPKSDAASLVTNGDSDHRDAIIDVLGSAQAIFVAVAFLKKEGARFLGDLIQTRLEEGASAEVIVGLDFYLTAPDALATLLSLQDLNDGLRVFVAGGGPGTFHPKAYVGRGHGVVRCLIGSANLTAGGLGGNVEASLSTEALVGSTLDHDLTRWAEVLKSRSEVTGLDAFILGRYRTAYERVQQRRPAFEQLILKASQEMIALDRLDGLYTLYRNDPTTIAELADRAKKRRAARRLQTEICELGSNGRIDRKKSEAFAEGLRDLMTAADGHRHLWPSDAIYRQGSRALDYPGEMIALFQVAQGAGRLPVESGYNQVRLAAKPIPGVGPNMITEILSTFFPTRYAVVNGNTREALALLGFHMSGSLNKDSLTPARYAEVRAVIAAVMKRIDAKDFPETDAFLNWLFQNRKRLR